MEVLGAVDVPKWVLSVVALILCVCLYSAYKQSYFQRRGIPTKRTWLFVGDIIDMARKGFGYVDFEMYKKYGKVFGTYIGNRPTLIISDPDMLKEITVKEFSKFTDRSNLISAGKRWQAALSIATGDQWRNLRHTLSPTFTSGKMRHMGQYLNRCLNIFHDLLAQQIKEHPEGFDMEPLIRSYTLDVICCTGFGMDISAQTDPDNPFMKHTKKALSFRGINSPVFILSMFFPDLFLAFEDYLPKVKLLPDSTLEFFNNSTLKMFEERKASDSKHKDLLQLMVNAHDDGEGKPSQAADGTTMKGLTDDEVLLNSLIFMLAGFDTTASTISWLVYDMAVHPDVQKKLVEAIDEEIGEATPTYDNVFTMRYLNMVINETMRMHPIASRINRQPSEDVVIKGVKLEKGLDCTYTPNILHFDPELWDEPLKYDPERFAPENKHKINEYAFIPFGVGPRNCIGQRLALLEVKMTLVSILQKYRIHKTDQLMVPMPISKGGIAKPDKPMVIRLEPRKK